jgi:hypothetical protein
MSLTMVQLSKEKKQHCVSQKRQQTSFSSLKKEKKNGSPHFPDWCSFNQKIKKCWRIVQQQALNVQFLHFRLNYRSITQFDERTM